MGLAAAVVLYACNGASIDGQAQEEHWGNTEDMHTIAPAKNVQRPDDSADLEDYKDTVRAHKGTRLDSVKSEANPLYKGDNSDTGKNGK